MFTALPLAANVTAFLVAAVVVWVAGGRIVRVADAVAARTGMDHAVLGMLLLGAVTSLPELAVAVTAGLSGNPALTVNGVLGSAGVNIVILAAADAFVRHRPLTSAHASAPLMLQAALAIVMLALPLGAAVTGDVGVLGVGLWSWLMLATYLAALRLIAKSQAAGAWHAQRGAQDARDAPSRGEVSRARLTVTGVVAAAAILVAGYVLAQAGEAAAEQSGLGTSFFASVFLAIATSLPEVSTVFAAVKLKRYELAIADVLGTNLFNITIVVAADALHRRGPVLVEVGASASFGSLLALLLTAVLLIGMIERRDRTIFGVGFDSLVIVATYVAGVVVMYHLR